MYWVHSYFILDFFIVISTEHRVLFTSEYLLNKNIWHQVKKLNLKYAILELVFWLNTLNLSASNHALICKPSIIPQWPCCPCITRLYKAFFSFADWSFWSRYSHCLYDHNSDYWAFSPFLPYFLFFLFHFFIYVFLNSLCLHLSSLYFSLSLLLSPLLPTSMFFLLSLSSFLFSPSFSCFSHFLLFLPSLSLPFSSMFSSFNSDHSAEL